MATENSFKKCEGKIQNVTINSGIKEIRLCHIPQANGSQVWFTFENNLPYQGKFISFYFNIDEPDEYTEKTALQILSTFKFL